MLIYKYLLKSKLAKYAAGAIASLLLASIFTFNLSGNLFKANTFLSVKHAPFDGTVYPYEAVPDWTGISDSERDFAYSEISSSKLLDPIYYNPSQLKVEFDSLGITGKDADTRNAKITYSVPYMGNYKLDGKEYAGSHAAVDIKMLEGTPILAMANGVVIKAESQPYGFGNHVVIRHSDVPSLDNPSKKTTYFSSYSHLKSFQVEPGEVVKKGQKIGLSGQTGTSTTPHLHFQIDKEGAPYYPYWPFSTAEANAAGLSFFEAINEGLGKQNGIDRTIHPMNYVQEYFDGSVPVVASEEKPVAIIDDEPEESSSGSKDDEQDPVIIAVEEKTEPEVKMTIEGPKEMILGQTYEVKVKYESSEGNRVASLDSEEFSFTPSLSSSFVVPRTASFTNGQVKIPFTPKEPGKLNVKVKVGSEKAYLTDVNVVLFKDVNEGDDDYEAIKSLKSRDVVQGYSDETFKPDNHVTRVEALKFLVKSIPEATEEAEEIKFEDIEFGSWYEGYLRKAVALGSIDAEKTSFEPSRGVNRAEFLKMLYVALNVDLDPKIDSEYSDLFDAKAWYAKYIQAGIEMGVITTEEASRPDETLTRRDIARIVYRFLSLSE